MPFILLSLSYLFLVLMLIVILTLGLLLVNLAFPNIFHLSVTFVNHLELVVIFSLIAAAVSAVCLAAAILHLLTGGGINAL